MAHQRRPLVAGNWKMNGSLSLLAEFQNAFQEQNLEDIDVLICPPSPYLSALTLTNVYKGAQTISEYESGAHTGDMSAAMAKEVGCEYVILGHSERRTDHHETSEQVAAKVKRALDSDLTPILCVGEPEAVREQGGHFDYIAQQLDAVVNLIGINGFAKTVIAYEPIWAIGTGKTASPEQAQEVHGFIRQHLAKLDNNVAQGVVILYGGSVKSSNAQELFSQSDVDGGLIGGASLDPREFLMICQAAKV